MSSTSAEQTVVVLRQLFATYGLPLQLVSDNGSQFTAVKFQHFLKENGVKHIRCTPYRPSSKSGLLELSSKPRRLEKVMGYHYCTDYQTFY